MQSYLPRLPEIILKINTISAITSKTLINAPPISKTNPKTQNNSNKPIIVHNISTTLLCFINLRIAKVKEREKGYDLRG